MIFRSRRRRAESEIVDTDDVVDEVSDADEASDADEVSDDASDASDASVAEEPDELAALDEQDWRTDGPFDITEVDDVTDDSDGPRIDLGSIVVTGYDGMELRLQVDEESQQIVSAMMISDESALEVGAFAAPRSGGFWAELRGDLIEAAAEADGLATAVAGPFGVELRRQVPVRTPDGEEGYQLSRMWMVEGPRWVLRGILYGPAALEEGVDGPVAPLLTAFRQVVVRRGEDAMAPGDLLPLMIPASLTAEESTLSE